MRVRTQRLVLPLTLLRCEAATPSAPTPSTAAPFNVVSDRNNSSSPCRSPVTVCTDGFPIH